MKSLEKRLKVVNNLEKSSKIYEIQYRKMEDSLKRKFNKIEEQLKNKHNEQVEGEAKAKSEITLNEKRSELKIKYIEERDKLEKKLRSQYETQYQENLSNLQKDSKRDESSTNSRKFFQSDRIIQLEGSINRVQKLIEANDFILYNLDQQLISPTSQSNYSNYTNPPRNNFIANNTKSPNLLCLGNLEKSKNALNDFNAFNVEHFSNPNKIMNSAKSSSKVSFCSNEKVINSNRKMNKEYSKDQISNDSSSEEVMNKLNSNNKVNCFFY